MQNPAIKKYVGYLPSYDTVRVGDRGNQRRWLWETVEAAAHRGRSWWLTTVYFMPQARKRPWHGRQTECERRLDGGMLTHSCIDDWCINRTVVRRCMHASRYCSFVGKKKAKTRKRVLGDPCDRERWFAWLPRRASGMPGFRSSKGASYWPTST